MAVRHSIWIGGDSLSHHAWPTPFATTYRWIRHIGGCDISSDTTYRRIRYIVGCDMVGNVRLWMVISDDSNLLSSSENDWKDIEWLFLAIQLLVNDLFHLEWMKMVFFFSNVIQHDWYTPNYIHSDSKNSIHNTTCISAKVYYIYSVYIFIRANSPGYEDYPSEEFPLHSICKF